MSATYTEAQLSRVSRRIIRCAIAVHRALGPGLPEKVYHNALILEATAQGVPIETEKRLTVHYRQHPVGDFRLDLLVEVEDPFGRGQVHPPQGVGRRLDGLPCRVIHRRPSVGQRVELVVKLHPPLAFPDRLRIS